MKKIVSFTIIIPALLMFLLQACQEEKVVSNKAVISGDLPSYEGKVFLSKVTFNNIKMLDSADLSIGEGFSFDVNAIDYSVFRLAVKDRYPLMVVAKAGDSIRIEEEINDKAWPYLVKGPEECMLLVEYLEHLNRDHYKVDSLAVIFQNSQNDPDFLAIREQLNDAFLTLNEEHRAYARKFITSHPSSIASMIVVNSFFKEFALFHQHDDLNYYELIDNASMERFPENRYAVEFHSQVENIRASKEYEQEAKMRLTPGRLVPEFELSTIDGEIISTKDLLHRNAIIYFWAAGDAKSRQTNPVIKAAYEAYNPYGMEVLAISFDKDRNAWQSAIRLDELPGIHASDLKGAGSPVQKLFNLKMQLPMWFLIDSKGRIYDHDRDFGKLQQSVIDLYNEEVDF